MRFLCQKAWVLKVQFSCLLHQKLSSAQTVDFSGESWNQMCLFSIPEAPTWEEQSSLGSLVMRRERERENEGKTWDCLVSSVMQQSPSIWRACLIQTIWTNETVFLCYSQLGTKRERKRGRLKYSTALCWLPNIGLKITIQFSVFFIHNYSLLIL